MRVKLLPHGPAAKKYYDWLGLNEMNDLYRNGVDGVRVILYGTTLDQTRVPPLHYNFLRFMFIVITNT